MPTSSTSRICIAGAITGLIIVLGEVVLNGLVLVDEWNTVNASLGLPLPSPLISTLVLLKLFALGFLIQWLYWAIQPRFGRGRKTALIAGGIVALIVWAWALSGLYMAGYVNPHIAWVTLVWGSIEVPMAAVLGVMFLERRPAEGK